MKFIVITTSVYSLFIPRKTYHSKTISVRKLELRFFNIFQTGKKLKEQDMSLLKALLIRLFFEVLC